LDDTQRRELEEVIDRQMRMLLNVIPAADGWAYLIIGRRSYEGAGVSVWKYSPAGPRDTGIAYRYGCQHANV